MGTRYLLTVPKDYYAGSLMVLIGLLAAGIGSTYRLGSLSRMGPGFFPLSVGVLLTLVGAGIVFAAWFEQASEVPQERNAQRAEWRGWLCIVGGLMAFVLLGFHGGFVPASAAIVYISALGDRTNSKRDALVLAGAMVLLLVVVFWWGLKMTFPLFAWRGW